MSEFFCDCCGGYIENGIHYIAVLKEENVHGLRAMSVHVERCYSCPKQPFLYGCGFLMGKNLI